MKACAETATAAAAEMQALYHAGRARAQEEVAAKVHAVSEADHDASRKAGEQAKAEAQGTEKRLLSTIASQELKQVLPDDSVLEPQAKQRRVDTMPHRSLLVALIAQKNSAATKDDLTRLLVSIFSKIPQSLKALDKLKPKSKPSAKDPFPGDPLLKECIRCNWPIRKKSSEGYGVVSKKYPFGNLVACKSCTTRSNTLTDLKERFIIHRSKAMQLPHDTGRSNYGGSKYQFSNAAVIHHMEEMDGTVLYVFALCGGL